VESEFGPLIVGEKAYLKREEERLLGSNILGPAVLSTEPVTGPKDEPVLSADMAKAKAAAQEQVAELRKRHPEIAEEEAEAAPEEPAEEPDMTGYVSLKDLKKALAENPEAFDEFFRAEFKREGGPRKGALQLFHEQEEAADEPRAAVLELIKAQLAVEE
jgi:hypothetical protein